VTIYLVVPFLAIIALLQTTIMPHLAVWGVFPDLPLLVVVSWSLQRGGREGAVWGFIAGMIVDLFSGAPFGAATLSLTIVGFLSGIGQITAFQAHVALLLLVMFLATILYDLIFLLVILISGQTTAWLDNLFHIVLPSAALNALLTPVVLRAMRVLHMRFGREEMEW
jgi:rod shape-determining protein MreD